MHATGGRYGSLLLLLAMLCTLLLTDLQSTHSRRTGISPVLNQAEQMDAYHGSLAEVSQTRDQLTGSITLSGDTVRSLIVVPDGTVVADQTISDT